MTDAEKKMMNETIDETDWDAIVKKMKAAKIKWDVIGGGRETPPVWRVKLLAQELITAAIKRKGAVGCPGLCANYDADEKVLILMSAIPVTITYLEEGAR